MSRWLDAEWLKEEIRKAFPSFYIRVQINTLVNLAPSIEVIRCGECTKRKKNKFCLEHMRYEEDDKGFCSHGTTEDCSTVGKE